MTHRVEQIVAALASRLETALKPKGAHVYTHRGETLDGGQDELPGVSVDFGELEIVEETEDELYCTLAVPITLVVKVADEAEAKSAVMRLARQAHVAIMVTPAAGLPWRVALGLAFVITVQPLGWDAPEFDTSGEEVVGKLTTNWRVQFKTDVDDPGDD